MAVKRNDFSISLFGEELKQFMKALEDEDRGSETTGPLLDLYETPDAIIVEADLPGIDPDSLDVRIYQGTLTVEGMRRERQDPCGKVNYLCMERSFEPFRRVVKITVPVNAKKAGGVYSMGVLTLSFPKVKDKRGLAVKIKVDRDRPKTDKETG